jgi:hypothetical protein
MDPKEDQAAVLQRFGALNCDLPEILVKRKEDPAIRLREIQECSVARAGEVGWCPSHMPTSRPERLNSRQREVLVRE